MPQRWVGGRRTSSPARALTNSRHLLACHQGFHGRLLSPEVGGLVPPLNPEQEKHAGRHGASTRVAATLHRRELIRLKRIYNFSCSMLVFTPFANCFVTLSGIFMHFPELTY
jgi:hypothetical protein